MPTTRRIAPLIRPDELEALRRQRPSIRLLDVRTPGEHESVHIQGSYNVPLDAIVEHGPKIGAHVEEPMVLICQSGQRARRAEELLRALGLPNLHVLEGGVNGWMAAGKPVVRGAARMSLERQVRVVAGGLAAGGGLLALTLDPLFALLPALVGSGLVFAGVTDTCGMAMVLSKLPYNRPASCNVDARVGALKAGAPPAGPGGGSATGTRASASGAA